MRCSIVASLLCVIFSSTISAEPMAQIPPDGEIATIIRKELKAGSDLAPVIGVLEGQLALQMIGMTTREVSKNDKLKKLFKNLTEKQNKQGEHYLNATILTADAYGLYPKVNSAQNNVTREFRERPMSWRFLVRPRQLSVAVDRNGRIKQAIYEKQPYAGMAPDGVVTLYPEAFSQLSVLATTIYHERVHFLQDSTRGWGDVLSDQEKQIQAYEGELRLAEVFKTSKAQLSEIRRNIFDQRASMYGSLGRNPRRINEHLLDESYPRFGTKESY
ncbi:MAG: hypothetical protein COV48_15315, partial [Elusimicrobia bacterium CG11_big_fil_rev_8_21_14_0_20_64_6]